MLKLYPEVHHSVADLAHRIQLADALMLTTPESLEVMLVSQKTDAAALFRSLRAVIVDEVHAFAGDDRGWHLLAVLSRIERLCGREFQRVGLSATVGNPEELLHCLHFRRRDPWCNLPTSPTP